MCASAPALGMHRRGFRLPLLAAFLDRLQDFVGAVEALGIRVPDLLHQLLRGVIALGGVGDLILLGREPHARQVLQEGRRVEVAEVTQLARVHVFSPPVSGSTLSNVPIYPPRVTPKTERLIQQFFGPYSRSS